MQTIPAESSLPQKYFLRSSCAMLYAAAQVRQIVVVRDAVPQV
jgi:hypothetical protein